MINSVNFYVSEKDYPDIKHSFDVWHGTKNLGKKLTKVRFFMGQQKIISLISFKDALLPIFIAILIKQNPKTTSLIIFSVYEQCKKTSSSLFWDNKKGKQVPPSLIDFHQKWPVNQ